MKSGENYLRIYFDWELVNWCDYRCSYCFVKDSLQDKFEDYFNDNFKNVLLRLKTVQTKFQICITGGEPTLHPNFIDILTALDKIEMCDEIIIFSNLARPIKMYKEIDNINSNKIKIFASFHPEFSNENFLEKCQIINSFKNITFVVHLTLLDKKEFWPLIKKLIKNLNIFNIKFKPMLLVNTFNYKVNYDELFYNEFFNILNNSEFYENIQYNDKNIKNFDLILKNKNKFKGWTCRTTSFRISMNGEIQNTCTNRKIPFILNNKNLIQEEICPHNSCISDRMLEFLKELK